MKTIDILKEGWVKLVKTCFHSGIDHDNLNRLEKSFVIVWMFDSFMDVILEGEGELIYHNTKF